MLAWANIEWVLAIPMLERRTFEQGVLNFDFMRRLSIWQQFRTALGTYASSFAFLRENGLRHGILAALLGAFATMKLVGWVLDQSADQLQRLLSSWVSQCFVNVDAVFSSDAFNWVFQGVAKGIDGLIFLLTLWIQFKVTKFLVLIVLSPVFAIYAELAAKSAGFHRKGSETIIWSIVRGLKSAALLVFLEIISSLFLFFVFGLLPLAFPALALIGWWLFPVLSTALSIWFYGAALLDFAWDLKGLGARHSLQCSLDNTGVVFALGVPFFVAMAVPVFGWLTGPILGGLMGTVSAVLCLRHLS